MLSYGCCRALRHASDEKQKVYLTMYSGFTLTHFRLSLPARMYPDLRFLRTSPSPLCRFANDQTRHGQGPLLFTHRSSTTCCKNCSTSSMPCPVLCRANSMRPGISLNSLTFVSPGPLTSSFKMPRRVGIVKSVRILGGPLPARI